ncbi:MAG TPA: bi-domain-containing oxidoreductase [Anaerolineales bacterium]|nr:bi-domain-containing oxidoreductase [Anaerolineales bacterium]HRQ92330.1 bi-domain-containing oxidoreductase [Anaerolineales bacterium]
MKQLLQNMRARSPHLAEVPVPTPQPGFVLVRNVASLVSAGTERMLVEFASASLLGKARSRPDLVRQTLDKARREGLVSTAQAALGRLGEPMALGYSSAGVIVELGESTRGFKVGQRVACAGGNYAVHAEYVSVPRNLVATLPAKLGFEEAAFTTLGAIALHGFRLAEAQVGARVAVIGLGLLGQLAGSIAAAAGCQVLGIDLDTKRVALAQARGLKAVGRKEAAERSATFTAGQGFDAVLICADTESNDPVQLAGEIARDRATVVAVGAVGMDVPRRSYYGKELSFIVSRSYGPGRYDPEYEEGGRDYPIGYVRWTEGRNLQAFADLMASGAVDVSKLISHRFPITEAPKAYELIQSDKPFLGVLITYPGAATAPSKASRKVTFEAKPLSKDKIGLGVLGAGNFARNTLLPALRGLPVDMVGITSASGRPAADLGKRFGFRYASSDEAQILADRNVDAVAILTRHNLHAKQTLATLKAGKHVFCEKPLALNEKELAAVERQVSKAGSPLLMGGFNRRFSPMGQELAQFLAGRSQPLAAHFRVNAGALPPYHWLHDPQRGGGRIVGEACHFIDFLIYLVGQSPSAVFAEALPDDERFKQDNVQITLRFADGSMGTVTYLANGDRSLPKERMELFCSGKVAVLDDFRQLELTEDGRTRTQRGKQDKGHRAGVQSFLAAIQAGGPAPIPYEQLFGGARAAFGALQSLETGKQILF